MNVLKQEEPNALLSAEISKEEITKWNGKKDNWKTVEMENSLLKCLNLLKMQKNTILKQ